MRQQPEISSSSRTVKRNNECPVAPNKTYNQPRGRDWTTYEGRKIPLARWLAVDLFPIQAKRWPTAGVYADDLLRCPCSPHGAANEDDEEYQRRKGEENTSIAVKLKNPDATANNPLRLSRSIGVTPSLWLQLKASSRSISVTSARVQGIKTQKSASEGTVVSLYAYVTMDPANEGVKRARRWISGAPGGWWPSDVDSPDEEFPAVVRPSKKRKTGQEEASISGRADTGTSSSESPDTVGPRSTPLPQSSPPLEQLQQDHNDNTTAERSAPASAFPTDHGYLRISSPGFMEESATTTNSETDDELDKLSTTALASDDGGNEHEFENCKSSSSSSGYASEKGAPAQIRPLGAELNRVEPEGREILETPAGSNRRRRTRAERAARDARWTRRSSVRSAPIEVVDLVTSNDESTDDEDGEMKQKHIDKFHFHVARFSAGWTSVEGQLLVKHAQMMMRLTNGATRAARCRNKKKIIRQQEEQARLEQEQEMLQDLDKAVSDALALPGPSTPTVSDSSNRMPLAECGDVSDVDEDSMDQDTIQSAVLCPVTRALAINSEQPDVSSTTTVYPSPQIVVGPQDSIPSPATAEFLQFFSTATCPEPHDLLQLLSTAPRTIELHQVRQPSMNVEIDSATDIQDDVLDMPSLEGMELDQVVAANLATLQLEPSCDAELLECNDEEPALAELQNVAEFAVQIVDGLQDDAAAPIVLRFKKKTSTMPGLVVTADHPVEEAMAAP
ncbi:hypothetical protein QAD02_000612 [Eretmocerus hayati]|uniref:Uncharacterized protein n=1 Tax=Eretmocerus hayati TaxID=131215 RepID=A0ACC2NDX0_9HYME|nr:hypothetical protein QAD02_000612 [Eretmocerus hayati]